LIEFRFFDPVIILPSKGHHKEYQTDISLFTKINDADDIRMDP